MINIEGSSSACVQNLNQGEKLKKTRCEFCLKITKVEISKYCKG